MHTIHYTTANGIAETAEFSTVEGRDLFTSWLDGEGLGWIVAASQDGLV